MRSSWRGPPRQVPSEVTLQVRGDRLHDLLAFRPQEETESTTVGGLVTEWLGRVPPPGETIERNGIRIEVLAGNDRRVEQVKISRAEKKAPV